MTQTALVNLSGDCMVSNINHHHEAVRQAFQSKDPVVLDLAQVAAVDITLVQLIVSASKTAAFDNRAFSLRSVSESVRDVLCSAGIKLNLESGQISF